MFSPYLSLDQSAEDVYTYCLKEPIICSHPVFRCLGLRWSARNPNIFLKGSFALL